MTLLAIDTSGAVSAALVAPDGTEISSVIIHEQRRHAEQLAPLIADLLAQNGLTSKDITVKVADDSGKVTDQKRTMWSTEFGPVIDFPGVGWTGDTAITYRDANIDNDEFLEQYRAMDTAGSFDEFVEAHKKYQGVPLFNTVAVSKDGRAWYADTSATPRLSEEALAAYQQALDGDLITSAAADSGAVLLDGS